MSTQADRTSVTAEQWLRDRSRPTRTPPPRSSDPRNPRAPRRYGQWSAAVLFVLVSVLLAGWLWQHKSDRQDVLALARPVPAGSVITAADLTVIDVAGLREGILAEDASTIEGSTAAVGLVPGEVLTSAMVTRDQVPAPGERVIGLELDATRAPVGLQPGDQVEVLAAPPSGDAGNPAQLGSPLVLSDQATVVSSDDVEGTGTRFTILVGSDSADRVASFGAAGRVALVQAPLGGDR